MWNKRNTILVVEDDHINFKYLEIIFRKTEYDIIRAENGMEAVEIFKNNSYIDLVLMDLQLPVMDGFEATRKIREVNGEVPIIAVTANNMADEKELCLNSGFTGFLTKPVRRDLLFETIEKHLEQNFAIH